MEFDTQKAARVWQRVQGEKQEQAAQRCSGVNALILEQQQLAAAYFQLSRLRPGKEGAVFMRLSREARAQADCLKGIGALASLQSAAAPLPQPAQQEHLLRRCCGRQLLLAREYESRCADAEYGPVFRQLARKSQECCCMVLALLGSAKGSPV